jgi:hypothetical protein
MNQSRKYSDIYPYLEKDCLLNKESIPQDWQSDMALANPDKF